MLECVGAHLGCRFRVGMTRGAEPFLDVRLWAWTLGAAPLFPRSSNGFVGAGRELFERWVPALRVPRSLGGHSSRRASFAFGAEGEKEDAAKAFVTPKGLYGL